MAPEIADSDEESDDILSHKRTVAAPHGAADTLSSTMHERDPVFDLSFDQFLTPTQRLSSPSNRSIFTTLGATNTPASETFESLKRPRSSQGSQKSTSDTLRQLKKRKKQRLEQVDGIGHNEVESIENDKNYSYNFSDKGKMSQGATKKPLPSSESKQLSVAATRQKYPATTMCSTMGDYHSINIDYSKTDAGFDYNPFGTLSQVSLDGEPNAETEKVVNLFRNASHRGTNTLAERLSIEDLRAEGFDSLNLRRAEKNDAISALRHKTQNTVLDDGGKQPIDTLAVGNSNEVDMDTVQRAGQEQSNAGTIQSTAQKVAGSKRGKKKATVEHPPYQELTSEDTTTPDQHLAKDEFEKASQQKVGDTRSFQTSKKDSKKDLSSDLDLDDPNVIGLPAESYVPRPSRRRAQRDNLVIHGSTNVQDVEEAAGVGLVHSMTPVTRKKAKGSKKKNTRTSVSSSTSKSNKLAADEKPEEVQETICPEEQVAKNEIESKVEDGQSSAERCDQRNAIDRELFDNRENKRDRNFSPPPPMAPSGSKISINVPPLHKTSGEQSPASSNRPLKKRGRKSKKEIEIAQDRTTDEEEDPVEPSVEERQRQPLQPKDLNIADVNGKVELSEKNEPETEKHNISRVAQKTSLSNDSRHAGEKQTMIEPETTTPNFVLISKYRLGLSKRHSIPSLLRKVDRTKEAPKVVEKKEKLTKKQLELREKERLEQEDAQDGACGTGTTRDRGEDGFLVEWDD